MAGKILTPITEHTLIALTLHELKRQTFCTVVIENRTFYKVLYIPVNSSLISKNKSATLRCKQQSCEMTSSRSGDHVSRDRAACMPTISRNTIYGSNMDTDVQDGTDWTNGRTDETKLALLLLQLLLLIELQTTPQ